jgi:hypothetical protein
MAKENLKPELIAQTNETPKSCLDCKVEKKITVTYVIKPTGTKSSKSLAGLPYAIAIDGVCPPEFKDKPGKAVGPIPTITVKGVAVGKSVSLFLGSDAKAVYRQKAIYKVIAGENNIKVTVQEKHGINAKDTDIPTLTKSENGTDIYSAHLTGDIWLSFSHKFTSNEVDGLVPESLSVLAKEAVKKIYDGKFDAGAGTYLSVAFEHPLKIKWSTSANVKENVSKYDERADVHTRVNPRTYAALIQAAEMAKLDQIDLSSGWRPMLGSVLHRIGLGLDVAVITKDKKTTSVSRTSAAKRELARAEKELKDANKSSPRDPAKVAAAKSKVTALKSALPTKLKKEAEDTDPSDFAAYRKELASSQDIVKQIFDPWKMDVDATDKTDATANVLTSGNETLHATHLHITAVDEGLGFASLFSAAKKVAPAK